MQEGEARLVAGLAMPEQLLGGGHVDVAYSLTELGRLYIAQGRKSEALATWQRAPAIRLRTRPGHPATRETADLLIARYREGGAARAAEQVEANVAAAARETSASGAAAVPSD